MYYFYILNLRGGYEPFNGSSGCQGRGIRVLGLRFLRVLAANASAHLFRGVPDLEKLVGIWPLQSDSLNSSPSPCTALAGWMIKLIHSYVRHSWPQILFFQRNPGSASKSCLQNTEIPVGSLLLFGRQISDVNLGFFGAWWVNRSLANRSHWNLWNYYPPYSMMLKIVIVFFLYSYKTCTLKKK